MTRRPSWLSAAAIGGAIALMAMSAAPAFAQDAAPEAPPEGGYAAYPTYAEVDCEGGTFNGQPYTGNLASIEATDDSTVVFTMCNPDPAFLPKIAFSAFAINDADYLAASSADRSIVDNPIGTGPYMLEEWRRGQEIIFTANPNYWGDAPLAATAVLRWSSEPGQKFIELQAGTVDGVDNPSIDDLANIEADPNLEAIPREGINVFYVGMNNTHPPFDNPKVRQAIAQGIDRQRIVDSFYAEGSEVADYFTPCSIEFACEGEPWYEFDSEAARALLMEGLEEVGELDGSDGGNIIRRNQDTGELQLTTQIHLRVVDRTYLPFPLQVAIDIKDQLETNLGIAALINEQESTTFIDNSDNGRLPGVHLLGWNADYPDPTNFLDYHFGPGATMQFGAGHPEIHEALVQGATSLDPEVRAQAYANANNAIKELVPMVPVARGASSTAWVSGIEGAHSSPLSNELFYVVGPGADDQLVFLQSGEPGGLFCPDESDGESLRACEQVHESLYGYEIAGTDPVPVLATECTGNEDATVWTCSLREGVTFHDGSTFEAADVVTSYAAAWDAASPLHVGRDGNFSYFPGLWGGFLNPPGAS